VNKTSHLSAFLAGFLVVATISGWAFVGFTDFGKAQISTKTSTSNSATQLWRSQVEGSLVYGPTVAEGYVYSLSGWSGGSDGYLYCFDMFNGNQIWNFSVLQGNNRGTAGNGGILYTGSTDENL
jgi:outer membrane protein assembly factor BamB